MASKRKRKRGVSLRMVYSWLILITAVVFGFTLFSIYLLNSTFNSLSNATTEHIELEKAAHELMDASDYLTESVQRFTVDGDKRFLDDYFTEAFKNNRRDEAIKKMSVNSNSTAAFSQLQEAMNASVKLMDQEYYAMRLVIDAMGYNDYPDVLKDIKIKEKDAKLSSEKKMKLANTLVLNDDYYDQKNKIRKNMNESLEELEKLTLNEQNNSMNNMHRQQFIVCILSIIQMIMILFIVILTSNLGIKPILKAVEKIKIGAPIPEIGANEFRYLAHTYNKMYSIYKNSLERLNFKASHDELTGAYNRSGYELLLSSVDLTTTHMILFDLDNFKGINDNFGHETGDRVLKKLVNTLKSNFRMDDYICRIGGDEFVVFMVHSTPEMKELISTKIEHINKQLSESKDGLPAISTSVGVVHGTEVKDTSNLFEKADEAMYESKQRGKSTYTFYTTTATAKA